MIHTQFHKMVEKGWEEAQAFLDKPTFFLSSSVVDAVNANSEAIEQTIAAIIEAKLFRLPYPEMVMIIETKTSSHGQVAVLFKEKVDGVDLLVCETSNSIGFTIFSEGSLELTEKGGEPFFKYDLKAANKDYAERLIRYCTFAYQVSVMILDIKNLNREYIEPTGLNRSRQKKGKPRIFPYTYVSLSKRYVSSEKGGSGKPTGRTMPVHMRAGHIRRQRVGKGLTEEKIIYIEPVIVNYESGEELKIRNTRVLG